MSLSQFPQVWLNDLPERIADSRKIEHIDFPRQQRFIEFFLKSGELPPIKRRGSANRQVKV